MRRVIVFVAYCRAKRLVAGLLLAVLALCVSCARDAADPAATGEDPPLASRGSIEVTAELVEIPEGAIFNAICNNYATVLKYRILKVHRGQVDGETIYVGHYNPFKPRSEAADHASKGSEEPSRPSGPAGASDGARSSIDDHYMGGIVNKYFGQQAGPIYWAVWTNLARQ